MRQCYEDCPDSKQQHDAEENVGNKGSARRTCGFVAKEVPRESGRKSRKSIPSTTYTQPRRSRGSRRSRSASRSRHSTARYHGLVGDRCPNGSSVLDITRNGNRWNATCYENCPSGMPEHDTQEYNESLQLVETRVCGKAANKTKRK